MSEYRDATFDDYTAEDIESFAKDGYSWDASHGANGGWRKREAHGDYHIVGRVPSPTPQAAKPS
jgi:hypothetical protein